MFIAVEDAKLYAVAFGPAAGPVLLAIGGWIGSWELWAEPFAGLSQTWRTIAYDHRGAGATVATVESITFDRLVDDVFAVLDAFAVECCVLAAESAGAQVALAAALKQPQRIRGLVIVDGLYQPATPPENDPFHWGLHKSYAATLDHFVTACIPGQDSEHIKRWRRQILDRADQGAAIALHLTTGAVDLRPQLGRITQPTLILHGEADAIVPVAEARRLAASLPNATLIVISGAGHVPTLTHPDEVVREITQFFT